VVNAWAVVDAKITVSSAACEATRIDPTFRLLSSVMFRSDFIRATRRGRLRSGSAGRSLYCGVDSLDAVAEKFVDRGAAVYR